MYRETFFALLLFSSSMLRFFVRISLNHILLNTFLCLIFVLLFFFVIVHSFGSIYRGSFIISTVVHVKTDFLIFPRFLFRYCLYFFGMPLYFCVLCMYGRTAYFGKHETEIYVPHGHILGALILIIP